MKILIFTLLFSHSSQALDLDVIMESRAGSVENNDPFPHKQEVEKKMQAIYHSMIAGQIPTPEAETEFFSGPCLTSYSASATPQVYSATVALRAGVGDAIDISYTTGQGSLKVFTLAKDGDYLKKMYTPKVRPSTVITSDSGGAHLDFKMADATASFPEVHAFLALDKSNIDTLYFIAPIMGYYCALDRVR